MNKRLARKDICPPGAGTDERRWNANRHVHFAAEDCLDAPDSKVLPRTEELLVISRRELPDLASMFVTKRSAQMVAVQSLRIAAASMTDLLPHECTSDRTGYFDEESARRRERLPRVFEVMHEITKIYPIFTVYYPDVLVVEASLDIEVAVQAYPSQYSAQLAV